MNRKEFLLDALKQRKCLKVIAGINNFDLNKVTKIASVAEKAGATCVDISTQAALREMILPGLVAVASPVVIGVILGPEALGGTLAGATATGVLLALFMANAGGAWDNAKKAIEQGEIPGAEKGDEAHSAAVVGDTIGDPFKDTSGPSLNILIKLMSIVSVVIASLIA